MTTQFELKNLNVRAQLGDTKVKGNNTERCLSKLGYYM
jgi:hypothetical protein